MTSRERTPAHSLANSRGGSVEFSKDKVFLNTALRKRTSVSLELVHNVLFIFTLAVFQVQGKFWLYDIIRQYDYY